MRRLDIRLWLTVGAALLLVACAAQKTTQRKTSGAAVQHESIERKPKASDKQAPAPTKPVRPPSTSKTSVVASNDVGYYLDVLQGRLQQSVDPGVIVSRAGSGIVLDFSRRFGFAASDNQLDEVDRKLLAPLAGVLVEYRPTLVAIRVSADDAGTTARALAQRRAGAIALALTSSGVSTARVRTIVLDAEERSGDPRVEIELEAITANE